VCDELTHTVRYLVKLKRQVTGTATTPVLSEGPSLGYYVHTRDRCEYLHIRVFLRFAARQRYFTIVDEKGRTPSVNEVQTLLCSHTLRAESMRMSERGTHHLCENMQFRIAL